MSSVNKVILVGNLGREPSVKSFQSGGKICEFSVATSERWTDKSSGEKKERTEWHSVVIRNDALIRVAENYLRKGSKVYVEGQLQTRKWQDQSGQDRYTTEVVIGAYGGSLTLLSEAQEGRGSGGHRNASERDQDQPKRSFAADLDDEIPFD